MTGQDLLDTMEALNQELQLQNGEADVVRALNALNRAQDFFESLAAQEGEIKGDTAGEVTTSANTETSSFPSGFLRIDAVQLLDDSTDRPKRRLGNLNETGSHAFNSIWPAPVSGSGGEPESYYTNGRTLYWSPLPDDTYTLRVYGFKSADNITAGGTFAYDDLLCLPFAAFAVRILKIGVGDEVADVASIAKETFSAAIGGLAGFNRDGATPLIYTRDHST